MKRPQESQTVARELSAALDPLIDVCLALGVTSPELEYLVRTAFVKRAFKKLPPHSRTGRPPSTSKVSMATGVHRNEVSKIVAGGSTVTKKTMQSKERLYSKSARVLAGWSCDPRFLSSGGQPLDLPRERNRERRSFEDLVDKYAPGNHPGTVLKEMKRRGNIELLPDDIVRFKSSKTRAQGLSSTNVAWAAQRLNRLGETLLQKISALEHTGLYEETAVLPFSSKHRAVMRSTLEKRVKVFLKQIENEFSSRESIEPRDRTEFRLGIFSSECID